MSLKQVVQAPFLFLFEVLIFLQLLIFYGRHDAIDWWNTRLL